VANPVAEEYEDEVYEDDEDYGEVYDEPVESVGLFSTPARTAAILVSVLLLFAVAGTAAWMLGQRGKGGSTAQAAAQGSTSANKTSLDGVVPTINNSNPGYAVKPAALDEKPAVGAMAPNFQWVDQKTGKTVSLESLHGKPVLVNFWGTWCPPCRAEMPEMEKLYATMKNDVTFLGVSMGPRDEPLGVAQFIQLNKYSWDFIHDGDSNVMLRYQVSGIPSSYFIDKTGVIRSIHVGQAASTDFEQGIQKAKLGQ